MSFYYTTPTFVLNHGERATRFTLQRSIYTNIPEEFMKIDLDCLDLCDWSCLGDFAKLSSLNCYTTTFFLTQSLVKLQHSWGAIWCMGESQRKVSLHARISRITRERLRLASRTFWITSVINHVIFVTATWSSYRSDNFLVGNQEEKLYKLKEAPTISLLHPLLCPEDFPGLSQPRYVRSSLY